MATACSTVSQRSNSTITMDDNNEHALRYHIKVFSQVNVIPEILFTCIVHHVCCYIIYSFQFQLLSLLFIGQSQRSQDVPRDHRPKHSDSVDNRPWQFFRELSHEQIGVTFKRDAAASFDYAWIAIGIGEWFGNLRCDHCIGHELWP